jgi:hypothetical protein
MALNLALIATVFLTRQDWSPWDVEKSFPEFPYLRSARPIPGVRGRAILVSDFGLATRFHFFDTESLRVISASATCGRHVIKTDFGFLYGHPVSPRGDRILINAEALPGSFEGSTRRNYTACVFDARSGRRIRELARAAFATYSSDGALVLTTGHGDRTARVWDAATGECTLVLDDAQTSAVFSPDGLLIATRSWQTAAVWDARTGKRKADLDACGLEWGLTSGSRKSYKASQLEFCAGAARVVSVIEGRCCVWDVGTGARVAELSRAAAWAVHRNGRRIITVDKGGSVSEWDAETGILVSRRMAGAPGETFDSVDMSPGDEFVVVRGYASRVHLWGLGPDARRVTLPAPEEAELTPDGTRVIGQRHRPVRKLTGLNWQATRELAVWDARSGAILSGMPQHAASHTSVLDADTVFIADGEKGSARLLRRIRPEWWWGVFWLPHFWLIVVLGGCVFASGWRDVRRMRRREREAAGKG